ncbi:DUF3108 domain-containing protein [Halorhodospira halophila]|uniref:DUF3108 domain-containing protein n=1 Tax=Halorhodospira halophila (strain DSM 244 / SL1) TaxID=349124 RepID=A1WX51_HALHL|nr:DUF3108 domain-containing protein [Halorhodospira halophila]ABM62263.1 conserved hypothetical protein [Halorhodospira halophila SL1]MBK1729238.1 DUF3108 domain-containing protein [Halorhodospira halophila]
MTHRSSVLPLRPRSAAIALLIGLGPALTAAGELPESGSARYWIQEGGEWRGYETVTWDFEADDTFRLERIREHRQRPAEAEHGGDRRIRRTREISEGNLEGDVARPETYEVRTATVFQPSADYDLETAFDDIEEETTLAARFTDDEAALEEDEIAVPANALDPLTHRWQVMQEALEGTRHTEITHQVVDEEGEISEVVFRVEGRQTVRAHPGTFRTVRLTRQQPGQQRAVRWYMAEGWAGLPVRTVDRRSERHAQRTRLERIEATGDG